MHSAFPDQMRTWFGYSRGRMRGQLHRMAGLCRRITGIVSPLPLPSEGEEELNKDVMNVCAILYLRHSICRG